MRRVMHDATVNGHRTRVVSGGHEIRILVTLQTFHIGHALVVIDTTNFMRLVTLDTDRNAGRVLFPQFTLDHLLVHRLDQSVTLLAGRGHVVTMD